MLREFCSQMAWLHQYFIQHRWYFSKKVFFHILNTTHNCIFSCHSYYTLNLISLRFLVSLVLVCCKSKKKQNTVSDNEALPTAGRQLTSLPAHCFHSLHLPSEPSPPPPPVRPGHSKLWGHLHYSPKCSVQMQLVCGDFFHDQLRTRTSFFTCTVINNTFFSAFWIAQIKPINNRRKHLQTFQLQAAQGGLG